MPKYIQTAIKLSFPIPEDVEDQQELILQEMRKVGEGFAMMMRGQMMMKEFPDCVVEVISDIVEFDSDKQLH